MTRIRSPTDRSPGFLNSAPTFDVRQRTISKCDPLNGDTRISGVPSMEVPVIARRLRCELDQLQLKRQH